MPSHAGGQSRFLIVRLSSFGDVVLSEPVVRNLKTSYPGCHVTFATYDQYAAVPAMFAGVDRVLAAPRGVRGSLPADSCASACDVAVDLQNNLRSRRLLRRLRPRRVLRYRRQYLRRFLRVYLSWLWRGRLKHTVQVYLEALRPLGIKAAAMAPEVAPPPEVLAEAGRRVGQGPLVAVCPGGSSRHKMWGRGRFAALVRLLVGAGHRVVVVGAESDRGEVEAVAAAGAGGAEAVVESDACAVAAVLSLCGVTVSNDSGLMHLAAAVGSRVVAIFGPTSPDLGFAPLAPDAVVVSRNAACSPCSYHGNRPCRYRRAFCLEDIEPAEVLAIVEKASATRS